MSKKIKRLFKPKSLDKENECAAEEHQPHRYGRSQSLRDVAPGSPADWAATLPAGPLPGAPGFEGLELPAVGSPITSPKEKKRKGLLSFRLKRKNSKRTQSSDLFFQEHGDVETRSHL
ncbi:hypothetical protein NHX12_019112 [Muraenolepis orangiensis]|uniref:Uncharacterized protein n=1 Tax=Muraenolepis orangiensis TaxID=630683 RepID=A0A9Q0ET24_9TELE|nr:hypothetical protein NHX12_019112 [Muraenolepis orangiensis]